MGNLVPTGSLDSQGFTDTTFIYYDKPFSGDFKISARIRMTANSGTSTAKGFHIGAYAPHTIEGVPDNPQGKATKAAGMLFRTSNGSGSPAAVRFYYSTNVPGSSQVAIDSGVAWHAGQNNSQELLTNQDWRREYIFEFARRGDRFLLGIRNSKQPTMRMMDIHPYIIPLTGEEESRATHVALRGGEDVYAGITLAGTSAEISEIIIWRDNAEPVWNYMDREAATSTAPVYISPPSTPAYVPAANIILTAAEVTGISAGILHNVTSIPDRRVATTQITVSRSSLDNGTTPITITPKLDPAWADENIGFELFYLGSFRITGGFPNEPILGVPVAGLMRPEGVEATKNTEEGVDGATYKQWQIFVNWDVLMSGAGDTSIAPVLGRFLLVARDLTLDTDEERARPDWPLLQTLPELLIQVRVNN
jgi:hypothetical protein